MRVVFLGTPNFAIPSLEALLESEHQVVGIITQPDRAAGRGQKITLSPVKKISQRLAVPVFQPQRLGRHPRSLEFLKETRPQVIVVAAFGQILKPEFFEYPPLGTVNVHASLLPKYRGAAPIAHALINGERETGVTIMKIDAGLDTGAILSQSPVTIGENDTCGDVENILAREGADLLLRTLEPYGSGKLRPRAQEDGQASLAPRIRKEDARIDWNWGADRIHNWVRALNPWPVAFSEFREERVRIWSTSKLAGIPPQVRPSGRPGQLLLASPDRLLVECGTRTVVSVEELQLPNRKRILARDFVNGLRVRVGEVFA